MDDETPQISFSTKELWQDIRDELRSLNQLLLLKADLSHVKEIEARLNQLDLEGTHFAQRIQIDVSNIKNQLQGIEKLDYPAVQDKIEELNDLEIKYNVLDNKVASLEKKMAFYMGGLAILVFITNFGLEKGWF